MNVYLQKKRICWLDGLKAIVICMVVLGHSYYLAGLGMDCDPVIRFIKPIEMPLFMFVSGYLTFKDTLHLGALPHKLSRLLVPYFSWAAIFVMTRCVCTGASMIDLFLALLQKPDLGLWFLLVLSACVALVYCVCALPHKQLSGVLNCITAIGLIAILAVSGFRTYGYHWLAWYYPFFLMGYFSHKHESVLLKMQKVLLVMSFIALATYISGTYWWRWKGSITFFGDLVMNGAMADGFRYALSFIGTLAISLLAMNYENCRMFRNKFLSQLGQNTLGVYAVHIYLIFYLPWIFALFNPLPPRGRLVGIFCVAMIISLVAISLIKLNRYLAYLLLGERRVKESRNV